MASINKVILIGNLGKDPEVKYAKSGVMVCSFSLATSENIKKGNEWEQKTDWHNITVFDKQAEFAEKYLKKGSNVYFEGRISYESWEDESGNKKYKTSLIGTRLMMLDKKDKADKEQEPSNDDLPF